MLQFDKEKPAGGYSENEIRSMIAEKERAMEKIREEEAQAFKAYVQSLQTDTK